ncbi:MAG: tetratricopeptide repeat protein [Planctomycetes bacterium]|nr:tetratricopeptide repeat protein [Planctomycetota bacterium]
MPSRSTETLTPPAETEYLFRHAAARDAAYQLLPMSQRARLHALALDILEDVTAFASLDTVYALAEHARLAQAGVTIPGSDLRYRELRYLRLSALNAASKYENDEATRLWERIADHPAATDTERAEALAEAGVLHWMLGRREPALRCFTRAIENKNARRDRLAYCLIERGTLHRDVREYEFARRDLGEALELARAAGDKHLQLRALGNLCTVDDEHMTQSGVKDLYAPVLKLAREIGDSRAVGITEGQIGLACIRGEEFADAEKHLTESIQLLREAGDRLNECEMVSALGELYRDRPDGDRRLNLMRAMQYYRDALELKDQLGYLFQKSGALTGLAAAHRLSGMLSEAEKYAREALQVATEVGDPEAIGTAYLELGETLDAMGDHAMAERTLSYGIVAVEDSGADRVKIQLLGALARLLAAQGDWDVAQDHAHSAVELAANAPDTRTRTRTRALLRAIERRELGPENGPS